MLILFSILVHKQEENHKDFHMNHNEANVFDFGNKLPSKHDHLDRKYNVLKMIRNDKDKQIDLQLHHNVHDEFLIISMEH
jgi:hypothetical protein